MQAPERNAESNEDAGAVRVGPLLLNSAGVWASVNGRDLSLTYAEFLILEVLVRNPYQALGRERLAAVIREAPRGSGGSDATPRSIDTHIARIRAKLRAAGYDRIKTMRYVGYRFVPSDDRPPAE